jgi:hypothetical protein
MLCVSLAVALIDRKTIRWEVGMSTHGSSQIVLGELSLGHINRSCTVPLFILAEHNTKSFNCRCF